MSSCNLTQQKLFLVVLLLVTAETKQKKSKEANKTKKLAVGNTERMKTNMATDRTKTEERPRCISFPTELGVMSQAQRREETACYRLVSEKLQEPYTRLNFTCFCISK